MKTKLIFAFLLLIPIFGISKQTFAGCGVSCAAVCRYTCEASEQPANCSDAAYLSAVQRCCEGAFRNTPGIETVPCTISGNEV